MSIVYIADQGSSLSISGERIYVKKGAEVIHWFHANDVEQLIMMGNVSLTAPVITYLLKQRVDTVFLSYYGKYKGRLLGEFGKNVQLRIDQYNFLSSSGCVKKLAAAYVRAKLENLIFMMQRRIRHSPNENILRCITQLRAILNQDMKKADSLESIRGYEGISAKYYFSVFNNFLKNEIFSFKRRTRRPPRDEINALLSLGYTFLMNQVQTQLYIVGLDTYYGALHTIDYGRQSLVLDLMEEYRPLIDEFVIKMINRREIRKEHFQYHPYNKENYDPEVTATLPVMLSKEGMKKFILNFQTLLEHKYFYKGRKGKFDLKTILLMQSQRIVRTFKGEDNYIGFNWKYGQPV